MKTTISLYVFGCVLVVLCVQSTDGDYGQQRVDGLADDVTSLEAPYPANMSLTIYKQVRNKRWIGGLADIAEAVWKGVKIGGRIAGAVLRHGRPLYSIVSMVCSGVQMGLSIAEASMECPHWKRYVCQLGGEIKIANDQYKDAVNLFLRERVNFHGQAANASQAYFINQEFNTTFMRIFEKTQYLSNLTMLNPDLKFLPRPSENPYDMMNVNFKEDHFEELVKEMARLAKPGWNKETILSTTFGALGFVFSSASLIYQGTKFRQASIDRTSVRAQDLPRVGQVFENGVRSLVPQVNGKYVVDDYFGHWEVDASGRASRRLTKGEMHQLKYGLEINKSKVVNIGGKIITDQHRYFKAAKIAARIGKFMGRYVFPAFDIVGSAFCIYSIDGMINRQVRQLETQMQELKSQIDMAKLSTEGNTTELLNEVANLRTNFTANVADVTILFAGLILDTVERAVNGSNPYAINVSQSTVFQRLQVLENNGTLTFETIASVQEAVRSVLANLEDMVNINLRIAQISTKVKGYLQGQGVPPSQMLNSLHMEGMNNLTMYAVLVTVLTQKPDMNYYYNWPICKIKNGEIKSQVELDALDVQELPTLLRSHINTFHRIMSIPVSQIGLFWNVANPTHPVSDLFVWQVIARELVPYSQDKFRDVDLAQYRTC